MLDLAELRRVTGAVLCADCGKCTSVCPLAESHDLSPRVIASLDAYEIDRLGDAVQVCLTCAACEQRCPQNVKFTEYIRGLKELTPTKYRVTCPHGEALQSAAWIMASDTDYKRDLSWLDEDLRVAEEGEVAYFMGCLPQFDTMFSEEYGVHPLEIARSAIRLLNHLGIEPVLAADERCCGHDQLWNGEPQAFRTLAKANAETFKARGVKHILTTCAECHRTWKVDMAEEVESYKPKVQHLSEFMAEQVAAGKLSFEENGTATVTLQDACRLGHHQGVIEPPRQVVGAMPGTETVEMRHSGRNAQCCGTSGFMFCDAASRQIQDGRLAEAAATGAQKLLTSCPKCYIHLSCAQAGAKRRGDSTPVLEVTDLTVFAASRLKESEGDKAPRAKSQGAGETS